MRTTCRSASQKTMSSDMRMKNMWIDFSRNARPSPGSQRAVTEQAARAAGETAREAQAVEQRPPVVRGVYLMPGVHRFHRSPSQRARRRNRHALYADDLRLAPSERGSMDAEDTQHDPLRDAREAALRRIGELRQRSARERASPRAPTCARCSRARSGTSTSCGAPRASSPPSCRRASRPPSRARWARTRAASAAGSTRSLDQTGAARGGRRARGERPARGAHGARRGSRGARRSRQRRPHRAARRSARDAHASWPSCRPSSGKPLHFTVAREDGAQPADSDAPAPALRVRASVEDAPGAGRAARAPRRILTRPRHTRA